MRLATARWTTLNGIGFNVSGWAIHVAATLGLIGVAERLVAFRDRLNDRFAERYGRTDDLQALRALERLYGREAA